MGRPRFYVALKVNVKIYARSKKFVFMLQASMRLVSSVGFEV